jgi:hypothetical protein
VTVSTVQVFLLIGIVGVGLVVWSLAAQRRRLRDQNETSQRLGFQPCPDRKAWLEETVTALENNRGYRYEVRDPRRLSGDLDVYSYTKIRHRYAHEDEVAVAEQEILFPLERPAAGALVLIVKPSSLAPGIATRVLGAAASGPWDAQPDDLERLELPPILQDSNVLAALGPSGASLTDVVDAQIINVMQGVGDAGGLFVRLRGGWCSVASASTHIPFKLDELLARIRPLLYGGRTLLPSTDS